MQRIPLLVHYGPPTLLEHIFTKALTNGMANSIIYGIDNCIADPKRVGELMKKYNNDKNLVLAEFSKKDPS